MCILNIILFFCIQNLDNDPMKALEASIGEIETQNDILQEKIRQNEASLRKADVEIQSLNVENCSLKQEIEKCYIIIREKDTILSDIVNNTDTNPPLSGTYSIGRSQSETDNEDDSNYRVNQLKCRILSLEKSITEKEKENSNLLQQLREIERKEVLHQDEIYVKNSRIAYLEQEEHR